MFICFCIVFLNFQRLIFFLIFHIMDYKIFSLHHRGMDCIGVSLSREDSRNEQIRKIPGIRWSQSNKCWYGEYSAELKFSFAVLFGEGKAAAAVGSGGSQVDEAAAAAVGSGSRQDDEEVEAAAAVGSGGSQVDEAAAAAVGSGSRQLDEATPAIESGSRQDDEAAAAVGSGSRQRQQTG
ncbi:MAG: hypothetical protein IPP71_06595 [Bacteroidetes bacterium]|nr:hypothetical protein [Bacteroidota bacterium]